VTIVRVSRYFYWIVEAGSFPVDIDPAASGTGLVSATGSTGLVTTGTGSGPVDVQAEVMRADPGVVLDDWDEIAEVGIRTSSGSFIITAFDGYVLDTLPLLDGAGEYCLRVHARGRDAASQIFTPLDEVLEHHLLQLWPATVASPRLLVSRDEFGLRFGRRLRPLFPRG